MELYTEAHYRGQSDPRVLVPRSLAENSAEACRIMQEVLDSRQKSDHLGPKLGSAVVLACHKGAPPEGVLLLTDEEQNTYFPPVHQSSVRILGSH
jgi:hypothetical protein